MIFCLTTYFSHLPELRIFFHNYPLVELLFFLLNYGFPILLMAVVMLKPLKLSRVLLVLSPLVAWPLLAVLYFFHISHLFSATVFQVASPLFFLGLFLLICVFIYTRILKNYWNWVDKALAKTFAICLGLASLVAFLWWRILIFCAEVSYSEKGIAPGDVDFCKFFNLYIPTNAKGSFGGFLYLLFAIFPFAICCWLLLDHFVLKKEK